MARLPLARGLSCRCAIEVVPRRRGRYLYEKRLIIRRTSRNGAMLDRITFDPQIMGGRACIRGMRIPAGIIVGLMASGASLGEILADYPSLEAEDVNQALAYAAWLAREEVVPA